MGDSVFCPVHLSGGSLLAGLSPAFIIAYTGWLKNDWKREPVIDYRLVILVEDCKARVFTDIDFFLLY